MWQAAWRVTSYKQQPWKPAAYNTVEKEYVA